MLNFVVLLLQVTMNAAQTMPSAFVLPNGQVIPVVSNPLQTGGAGNVIPTPNGGQAQTQTIPGLASNASGQV